MNCNACGGEMRKDGRPRGRQRWKCTACGVSRFSEWQRPPAQPRPCAREGCDAIIPSTAHSRRKYHDDDCAREAEAAAERERKSNPDVRARRASLRRASRAGLPPPCSVCGGPTTRRNVTGVCTRNENCKKINRSTHDQNYYEKKKDQKGKAPSRPSDMHPWQIPESYDLDTCGECHDILNDECEAAGHRGEKIIDYVAVEVATAGLRHVRLTETEQQIVVRRMMLQFCGWRDICEHLGVGTRILTGILDGMGYEVIIDPTQQDTKYSKRRLIVPRDRPRGEKILG